VVDDLLLLHYLEDIDDDDEADDRDTEWDGFSFQELGIPVDDEDDIFDPEVDDWWPEEAFDDDPGELGVEPDSY
jgi:hypothetical protein